LTPIGQAASSRYTSLMSQKIQSHLSTSLASSRR
jgi:hypothetical protein